MTKHRDDILRLRSEGKTYNEIQKELGCSKGTISYHLGHGQKQKTEDRRKNLTDSKLRKKVSYWKNRVAGEATQRQVSPRTHNRKMLQKVREFQKERRGGTAPTLDWTYDDLREIIADYQCCYLTGREIDVNDCDTFHLDHIEPRSRGGDNSIENLGLATPEANYAKGYLPLEDFIELCLDVVIHWGLVDENDVQY